MKKKILIIRPSALGDTLMLLPALIQLKATSEITLAGRAPAIDLLRPHVQAGIDFEGPGWHRLFMENGDPGTPLPLPPVDQAVAFMTDPEGRLKDNLRACLPGSPVHMYPPFPPEKENIHVALYLAHCLQRSGLPLNADKAIEYADRRPLFGERVPTEIKQRIIFHPGSGGRAKNHSHDFWLDLILTMRKNPRFENATFLLLLGPAEEPSYTFFKENAAHPRIQILLSPEKQVLVTTIRESLLFLGQDSGITHLAAMHGTPTIALFKNSNVYQWRPIGPAVRVIEDNGTHAGLIRQILNRVDELIKVYQQNEIQESAFGGRKRKG